jgi:hypothetical protein
MRLRPFIFSALAVTALLALAASAAGTRPLSAGGRRSGALPSSLYDYTFTTLVIVAAVVLVVVARFIPILTDGRKPRRSFPARVFRTAAIVFVVLALIAVTLRHLPLAHHLANQLLHLDQANGNVGRGKHGGGAGKLTFRWEELLVFAGLGLLVLLAVLALRPRATGPRESDPAETIDEAIRESIDDLRTDPDLRRAIVAAYARMERALAASGVPRDPAEAPHEYLERALLAVDTSAGAARRLTELFEEAKFSQHELDSRMRDDAIDALVAVRDELSAASKVAA